MIGRYILNDKDLLQPDNETEKILYAKCDSLLDVIDLLKD